MIDLHCHILPQLDDGSESLEESLAMARLAANCGVTAIVATPHCVDGGIRQIHDRVLLLRDAMEDVGIPVRLYMGMELFGTADTARLLSGGRLLTLNGSRYPLIEFSFHGTGEAETEILEDVLREGFVPVVAHPERYAYIQEEPRIINEWKAMGCLFQINRGSLLGRFGSNAWHMGWELVKRGFATVIASDGHSARMRTPWMGDIREKLSREVSPDAARWLLDHNPNRILNNQTVEMWEPVWF